VYAFEAWSQQEGDNLLAPRKATAELIGRVRGQAIDGTAQEVARSEIDGDGWHRPAC
jgi:hypothetical protein